ncbi:MULTISPECIES: hypothetical protein [Brucella]|uniref:hypothetical protein n=1 Tax=Brucella TaxID=234 RepID=UPI000F67B38F|nr:hypothetical protein [Brucella anthropi]MCR5943667.1 hypothetical protein [Ochrobactrum sp. XJ1]RRY15818.1 hypothetical protein EGJ57_23730 [Brucella anthropi]
MNNETKFPNAHSNTHSSNKQNKQISTYFDAPNVLRIAAKEIGKRGLQNETWLTNTEKSPLSEYQESECEMAKNYPWDYHADLTEERLREVGAMIVDGRHAALDRFDAEAGDNGWTHGCRAFQFSRHRILTAVDSGEYPWLSAIDRSSQLVFKIGEVPIRIYKGLAEEPTGRTLRQSHGELLQLGMLFAEHDEGHDLAYRFAVETDIEGSVIAVNFVGLHGQTAVLNWQVPFDSTLGFSGTVGREASESVELGAPRVGLRSDRIEKDGGADD